MVPSMGKSIVLTAYVDADHVSCQETRTFLTGILLIINNNSIYWYSKIHNIMEMSMYRSELVSAIQIKPMRKMNLMIDSQIPNLNEINPGNIERMGVSLINRIQMDGMSFLENVKKSQIWLYFIRFSFVMNVFHACK